MRLSFYDLLTHFKPESLWKSGHSVKLDNTAIEQLLELIRKRDPGWFKPMNLSKEFLDESTQLLNDFANQGKKLDMLGREFGDMGFIFYLRKGLSPNL